MGVSAYLVASSRERPLWVISGHEIVDQACPLHPQERTCSASASMSTSCQEQTLCRPASYLDMPQKRTRSLVLRPHRRSRERSVPMLTKRELLQSGALAAIAAAATRPGPALAQMLTGAPAEPDMKYSTPMPSGIAVPDRVETRLGTLSFFDGFPDKDTADKLFDNLDFQRAVQAYLLAIPAVSQVADRNACLTLGPANLTIPDLGTVGGLADRRPDLQRQHGLQLGLGQPQGWPAWWSRFRRKYWVRSTTSGSAGSLTWASPDRTRGKAVTCP